LPPERFAKSEGFSGQSVKVVQGIIAALICLVGLVLLPLGVCSGQQKPDVSKDNLTVKLPFQIPKAFYSLMSNLNACP
jgi:hypothetical protein